MDGRHHFAANSATPLGRTNLRDRLLTARGWKVVRIWCWDHVYNGDL